MMPRPVRETLPDALRAIAMVSVLTVNAIGYQDAPWGPALGLRTPDDSRLAAAVQGLVGALLQGKGYAMLAFVFGMALWLAARDRPRAAAAARGRRRQRRLLGLGVVHGALLYFGDILTLYALVGRQLLRRLHMPWKPFRRHLWRAVGWALLAKFVTVVAIVAVPVAPYAGDGPSLSSVDGAWEFLRLNAGFYAISQVLAVLVAGPVMYLCMVGGVAAARLRLLTHRRWRPLLRRGLWRAGPVLLALCIVYGVGCGALASAGAAHAWNEALGELINLPVAAWYIAVLAVASNGGRARCCEWLVPLGRRTLTLYVGHSLLCVLLFSGAGLALAFTTAQTVAFSLGLWLLALLAAHGSGTRRWPLEAWMGRA